MIVVGGGGLDDEGMSSALAYRLCYGYCFEQAPECANVIDLVILFSRMLHEA